ncbi:unnamed protein product [Ixodes persulcatus]
MHLFLKHLDMHKKKKFLFLLKGIPSCIWDIPASKKLLLLQLPGGYDCPSNFHFIAAGNVTARARSY